MPKKLTSNNFFKFSVLIISFCIIERGFVHFYKFSGLLKCNSISEIEKWTFSFNPDTNICTGFIYTLYTINASKKEVQESINSTLFFKDNVKSEDNVNIILVIGESYNKHHSNLYGYKLATNPLLYNEEQKGNLFVFQNVVSPYNLTSYVMKNLFSTNSMMDNEKWARFPVFPAIFRKAGYQVYFWDNQYSIDKIYASDFALASYIHNPKLSRTSYTRCNKNSFKYDLDLFHSFTSSNMISSNKNLLIFHLMGQHIMPAKRYPHIKQFNHFTVDSIKRNNLNFEQKRQIAYYDNATLYNDYVLYRIINKYRNLNTVLIYLSDHGEEIYDYRNNMGRQQGKVLDSNILKNQYEIPFLIWCSNTFINRHPGIIKNIKKSLKSPFMSDNTCQIMFGICGIKTKYYHPQRDLLNNRFRPYNKRIVSGNTNYDITRWQKNNK